jgi:predicted metal-dependent phosphoesterase TrpH
MSTDMDLHIHSKYSMDSVLEPKTIIKLALKWGLSAILITDHNITRGSLKAMREASMIKDLKVIPGVELRTDVGDVIGLYVQDEIKARDFNGVVEEIKNQDGLVVLPHPYNGHEEVEELVSYVDIVEVLNGRSSHIKNAKALRLANDLGKPAIACSDSHFSFEIGRIKTRFYGEHYSPEELRNLILEGDRELIGTESSFMVHGFSFAVMVIKRVASIF